MYICSKDSKEEQFLLVFSQGRYYWEYVCVHVDTYDPWGFGSYPTIKEAIEDVAPHYKHLSQWEVLEETWDW